MVKYSKTKQTETKLRVNNLGLCSGLITEITVQATAFLGRGFAVGKKKGLPNVTVPGLRHPMICRNDLYHSSERRQLNNGGNNENVKTMYWRRDFQ